MSACRYGINKTDIVVLLFQFLRQQLFVNSAANMIKWYHKKKITVHSEVVG